MGDDAPDAPRKGTAYVLWTILLWIDLAFIGLNALANIAAGLVLVFAPDSQLADQVRETVALDSPAALLAEVLLTFLLFGVIPFLWVVGTRRDPAKGTVRFLHLHEPARGILRGVLLAIPLLVAVAVLGAVYTVATQGWDGLSHPVEEENPAVDSILANLNWPLAVLVALCAGLGEEILFRGFLQRYIGLWGQAVLFGLAHAAGGYIPQVVFALGLGIFFGYLVKRGWSLWSLITAHALYDFTLLAIGLYSR